MKSVTSFLLPGGLLFLLSILFLQRLLAAEGFMSLFPVTTYIVWGLGVFLTWRFHHVRVMIFLFLVAISWEVIQYYSGAGDHPLIFKAVLFLLPLNVLFFMFFPQRGFLHPVNVIPLAVIMAQVPVAVYFLKIKTHLVEAWIMNLHLEQVFFPGAGILLWIFPFMLALFRYLMDRDPVDNGFFWAFASLWFGLTRFPDLKAQTLFSTLSCLILVISILEKSYRLAYRDELTGLPTRRAMNEYFKKLGSTYTVAMADVDHFKRVNDRYGHQTGDQVLKMVAAHLQKVRGGGKTFRYGGEEFTLVFPGKTQREAVPYLEDVRETLQDSPFILRGTGRPRRKPAGSGGSTARKQQKTLKVTVSMGVATPGDKYPTPHLVIKAADKALYRAKKAGRNCIKTQGRA